MGWLRSNSGKFAWVAFFALACQFALTFGHLHLSNFGVISAALTSPADSTDSSTGAQSSPAQQAPTRLAQDFCAVCNNISLANTLVLPVSPAPISPTSIIRNLWWPPAGPELASGDHFPFDARGPPRAWLAAT
jgi:hypothetical protein